MTARYPDYSTENRAREVLARMAEQGKRPIFLDRLYGMIRALRRLGFSLQLNNTDIRQMVVDAGRFLRRAPAARVSAGMQEAAASMAASEGAASPNRAAARSPSTCLPPSSASAWARPASIPITRQRRPAIRPPPCA